MALISFIRAACFLLFLLGCVLLSDSTTAFAQNLGSLKAKTPPKGEKIPANLSPEQVDSYLAGVSDEQARRLLTSELKAKAAATAGNTAKKQIDTEETGLVFGFYGGQRTLSSLFDQLAGIISGARLSAETDVWARVVGGKGLNPFLTAMASLVLIVLIGLAAERLLLRKTEKIRRQLLVENPQGGWAKAGVFVSRLILDLFGLGVYMIFTFLACWIFYRQGEPAYLVSSAVIMTYYLRLIELAVRWIVSPKIPELRLIFMSDSDARLLYNWIILLAASVFPGTTLALSLKKSGASRELLLLVYSSAGPIISILLAVMIWQIRRRVAAFVCPLTDNSVEGRGIRRMCADYWHYPAILFVLTVGGFWWVRVLSRADATILRLTLSLLLVPLCIGADQWLQRVLIRLRGKPREIIDFSLQDRAGETEPEGPMSGPSDSPKELSGKNMSLYFPLIHKIFRMVLLVFLFFAALELWGIELESGWFFAKSVLGAMIALLLGLIAWEVVKTRIDSRIEDEMPLQSDEFEEGGSGGSRRGTILLLLRKFILVILFIIVGFSILSLLGVNITPLLAGAGVIGLAIGFGSQTLVKDIISGAFFLIDDAFRVGDYIQTGAAKGTVEHISLRSVRLRHPRGQIFIVPFGDLKLVENFTRDYIIEKLDVRIRFDTDPIVIRKIIKKINKEMRENEDFAKALLSNIKSTGISSMDDSALIIRVKFTCIPGEQWVLRREVFHRIQKAFKEKGIEFAHRNVTVYLPPQPATEGDPVPAGVRDSVPVEAAGAAAAAVIAQAEAEELAKLTGKK
ncbi:MAG: mechanosensitive ion channel family protein [Syntrophobacteraceae bacterium]